MNPGGDAAEQIVRLSLEGVEVAAKVSGYGAKNLAVILYAVLKQEQKTKGKARLTSMLRSGKELKVYTITQKDLAKFSQEAKRYGVLYCVLKDGKNTDPNAAVDVIARAEDASKIQRITERFKLMTVDKAEVTLDIQRARENRKVINEEVNVNYSDNTQIRYVDPELNLPSIDDAELAGRTALKPNLNNEEPEINPLMAKTGQDPLSEPSLRRENRLNGSEWVERKLSVREKLNECLICNRSIHQKIQQQIIIQIHIKLFPGRARRGRDPWGRA